jgi:flavin reductase (DIM6/NTAB) family NADH-FMN oxidoreductase RutF
VSNGAPHSTLDRKDLRAAFGGFATGVTVVTTEDDGVLHGMTANSFTSVSLDPPLLLLCFQHGSRTVDAVEHRHEFIVNVLDHTQAWLSHRFARRTDEPFSNVRYRLDDHGLPVLSGGVGHFACEVDSTHVAGDHVIVIGAIRRAELLERRPLVFYRGRYRHLTEDASPPETLWYA